MNSDNTKSSVTAGILGVFLGAFGGHDWYLGNTKKAITHVCLCVGGLILLMLGLILTNLANDLPPLRVLFICLIVAAYVIIVGNGVWGFIEGIIIIAQGDAGLAAKGYKVAVPATQTMAPNAPVAPAANEDAKIEPAKVELKVPEGVITATPAEASVLPGAAPLINTAPAEEKKEEEPVVKGAPFAPVDTPVAPVSTTNETANTTVTSADTNTAEQSATKVTEGGAAVETAKEPVVNTVTPDLAVAEANNGVNGNAAQAAPASDAVAGANMAGNAAVGNASDVPGGMAGATPAGEAATADTAVQNEETSKSPVA